jgi:creatinine amidohydrolase/Fe(II)-dependent formamide hydrolase-like protein
MRSVAARLNDEWKGRNVGVFALDDYYDEGRVHYRAWLQAAFGYDDTTVGTHAGISDTSQLLFVRPSGVRKDQIKPWGGPQDSGVSGDPAKATAEIGRMGLEFKVNAAINQYKRLKAGGERREAGAGRAQGGR